jgi:D-glycero-alpha-D-manno-heptose-7-phosphate kinase
MSSTYKRLPRAVTTITPQRISFVGGGTDLPAFFREHGGAVISSAIDQYVYVTAKRHSPLFQEAYRLSYSKTEHVDQLDDIENGVARECLRLVKVDPPLYISTASDLPAASGLGSSSSFAVGLLHALHLLNGERVSPGQLAEEACEVEISMLGNPIGKQDQYAAAFGGLNYMFFKKNDRVEIDHLVLRDNLIHKIFDNSLLIWSGIQRDASNVLLKQKDSIETHLDRYKSLINDVGDCKKLFLDPSSDFLQQFGHLMERTWATKKMLEKSISSGAIDDIHLEMKALGAFGGKLSGAGGGGFFYSIVPRHMHDVIFKKYGSRKVLRVGYEPQGSRLLSELS